MLELVDVLLELRTGVPHPSRTLFSLAHPPTLRRQGLSQSGDGFVLVQDGISLTPDLVMSRRQPVRHQPRRVGKPCLVGVHGRPQLAGLGFARVRGSRQLARPSLEVAPLGLQVAVLGLEEGHGALQRRVLLEQTGARLLLGAELYREVLHRLAVGLPLLLEPTLQRCEPLVEAVERVRLLLHGGAQASDAELQVLENGVLGHEGLLQHGDVGLVRVIRRDEPGHRALELHRDLLLLLKQQPSAIDRSLFLLNRRLLSLHFLLQLVHVLRDGLELLFGFFELHLSLLTKGVTLPHHLLQTISVVRRIRCPLQALPLELADLPPELRDHRVAP
mmetsp:Transcript_10414/g.20401  ORF Transcript_10414/g.20401 Transcript_10414/m.20401 type:complete len:332 (-) Transcript_10414:19-1014(-)